MLYINVRYFDMGLLAGQDQILAIGDSHVLSLKYMEGLSRVLIAKFAGCSYNRYDIESNVKSALKFSTVRHLIDDFNFTIQDAIDFMKSVYVETIDTTYDIQDYNNRKTFIRAVTTSEYVEEILNRRESYIFVEHNSPDGCKCVPLTALEIGLRHRVEYVMLALRLRFLDEFKRDTLEYVLKKFGYTE